VSTENSAAKLSLAVFKFASCDGCQLSLLDCEDELLSIANAVEIAYFLEASSHITPGPYDVALVEGSITTKDDAARIQQVRQQSKLLVTIGACATAGGIQSLKNWANHKEFLRCVYAYPEFISTLDTSTPIAAHVHVDFELRGCPISRQQLLDVITCLIAGRAPRTPDHSVCLACKRRGNVCVEVAKGIPCLGPITQTGCGALCPTYDRGCYGCFGPVGQANCQSLTAQLTESGVTKKQLLPLLRNFNASAPAFQQASESLSESNSSDGKADD
jgi:coenzyme F420-reducing hydrogenase gamma subunit